MARSWSRIRCSVVKLDSVTMVFAAVFESDVSSPIDMY